MARRKQNLTEDLIEITSKLPWWVGVVLAIVAYAWLHNIAAGEVTAVAQPGQMGQLATQTLFKTLALFGQYLLPFAFLAGAAMSVFGRYKRRALHEQVAASPDRGALNDMSWQQFEALVGEAFRRKGYAMTETGGGGADGGIDLALKKEGETFLVQCKQWKAYKVSVTTVRELYGVMAAEGATGGFVVTSGVFTDEARAFAVGRNIELMDGKALHALIRGVSVPSKAAAASPAATPAGSPACPVCQSAMVRRTAKRGANSGNEFWGCSHYPGCKGIRAT
ncbi:MAG: restriction endonuclease [Gammaproteobacteria bacterium]|nr:restriction endonuclease [Gammaproteobacteria bacterium]